MVKQEPLEERAQQQEEPLEHLPEEPLEQQEELEMLQVLPRGQQAGEPLEERAQQQEEPLEHLPEEPLEQQEEQFGQEEPLGLPEARWELSGELPEKPGDQWGQAQAAVEVQAEQKALTRARIRAARQ
jgi:hypothetical protein